LVTEDTLLKELWQWLDIMREEKRRGKEVVKQNEELQVKQYSMISGPYLPGKG
jgi:hypothetical protein